MSNFVKIVCIDAGTNRFAVTRTGSSVVITSEQTSTPPDTQNDPQIWNMATNVNGNLTFYVPNNPLNALNFVSNEGPVAVGAQHPILSSWNPSGMALRPTANINNMNLNALGGISNGATVGVWEWDGGSENESWTLMNVNPPSTPVVTNAEFIISFMPPGSTIEVFTSDNVITSNSYEKITSNMLQQTYNAGVEAEYGAKVSASTSIKIDTSTLVTIENSLQTEVQNSTSTTITVGATQVGILVASGTIMIDCDGNNWMFITGACTNYAVINLTDWPNLQNHYDLTGTIDTQMPELQPFKAIQNGYVFYKPI